MKSILKKSKYSKVSIYKNYGIDIAFFDYVGEEDIVSWYYKSAV